MQSMFITGGDGYLGRNLVQYFTRKFQITTHTRTPPLIQRISIQNTYGDLEDSNVIQNLPIQPNIVIHAAAKIPKQFSSEIERNYFTTNVHVTEKLANKALSPQLEKFIFISTVNLYNKNLIAATETAATGSYFSEQEYFLSKEVAERRLIEIFKDRPQDLLILRIGTPYGNDEPSSRLIPTWIDSALNAQNIKIFANPSLHLNYVHIRDIGFVISRSLEENLYGVYNVSAEGLCTLDMIASKIVEVASVKSRTIKVDRVPSFINGSFPTISTAKLRARLNFSPTGLLDNLGEFIRMNGTKN
jgi:nucleoside-diphosphate-sugar epimerase